MSFVTCVSQSKFAALVGVSQPAVSKAIRAGRLIDAGRGIDLQHPASVAYAELHAAKRAAKGLPPSPWTLGEREPSPAARGQRTAKRARPKPKSETDTATPPAKAHSRDRPPAGTDLGTAKRSQAMHAIAIETKQYELDLKRTKVEQEQIKLRAASRSVIALATVNSSISRLGAVLEDHLRSFGERHAAALVAAVQGGRHEGAIADMLDVEIDRGVSAFKRAAMRELETLSESEGK